MKVIVAGLPKTGTKSMQAVLLELGYTNYDYVENFLYLRKDWIKIFKHGIGPEDFYRMFKNVDSITDVPGCVFWDEIHKAFPDAKIILTVRENEDVWFKSFEKQLKKLNNFFTVYGPYLSPTLARLAHYGNLVGKATFGPCLQFQWFHPLSPTVNKSLACMIYRRHNSHVIHTAPKDKLLVFNMNDGWGPLCQFLDVDIPDKPFPYKNVKGSIVDEYIKTLPLVQQAKTEIIISISLLSLVVGFGVYKIANRGNFRFVSELLKSITSLIK